MIAVLVGLVAIPLILTGILIRESIRRRQHPSGAIEPSRLPIHHDTPERRGLSGASVAGGILGVLDILLIVTIAQGEARGHAGGHMILGVVAMALFVALRILWRTTGSDVSLISRQVLLTMLWISAVASLLESIGAVGYDRHNSGERIAWLTAIHGPAGLVAALALLTIPLGAVALLFVVIGRVVARLRPSRDIVRPGSMHESQ